MGRFLLQQHVCTLLFIGAKYHSQVHSFILHMQGSRLCSIEDTQDRTVRATEALVGFGQQMEHGQNGNFRQVSRLNLHDCLLACCLP
jgi:hypothetical protein